VRDEGAIVGLRDYLNVLRQRWVSVVVPTVLMTVVAAALSLSTTPTYTSTTSLFFSLQNGNTANELAQGSNFTQAQMASYATLVTTPAVLTPVIEELGLSGDARDLARRIDVSAPNETVVLEVSVSDTSPERAAAIARAVTNELRVVVADVAPRNSDGNATVTSTIVTPADVPETPSAPNTELNVMAGLLLGLVLGVLLALLRQALDTRVRDAESVRVLTDAPVLGSLVFETSAGDGPTFHRAPRGPQAETYRQLRTSTQFLQTPGRPLSLVVTSSLPGEGKSTVAVNLAVALAEVYDRVLLVDADLRRPTVADRLDLEGAAGLSTVLIGRAPVEDVVQEWGPHRLAVLASGAIPPNPAELLASPAMRQLTDRLTGQYDVIVWDAPPLLPVTDTRLLTRHADGVLMVVNTRKARRAHVAAALESLKRSEARVLGVVLNMLPARAQAPTYGYEPHEDELAGGQDSSPAAAVRRLQSSRARNAGTGAQGGQAERRDQPLDRTRS
jgi:polysaccharide biosynthesis transport protein